jgi:hypothetical protein
LFPRCRQPPPPPSRQRGASARDQMTALGPASSLQLPNERLLTFAISSAGARHNFSIQDTFQISPSHPLSYFFLASDVVIFCTLLKVILRAQTDTRNINLCLMERKMKKKIWHFSSLCLPLMLDRRRGSYRLRKKLPRYIETEEESNYC